MRTENGKMYFDGDEGHVVVAILRARMHRNDLEVRVVIHGDSASNEYLGAFKNRLDELHETWGIRPAFAEDYCFSYSFRPGSDIAEPFSKYVIGDRLPNSQLDAIYAAIAANKLVDDNIKLV
jgi:hypothetical protein